jgi:hypothetical protein
MTIACLTLPVTLVHVNLLQNKPKMQLAIQTRRFLSLLLLLSECTRDQETMVTGERCPGECGSGSERERE